MVYYCRDGLHNIKLLGKIDTKMYDFIPSDICSDDVVLTKRQFQHIGEKHPEVSTNFDKYFPQIIENPDYIIESDKPNTAILLYRLPYNDKIGKAVLRLATVDDNPNYKNSIITFMCIDDRELARLLRNKKVVYIKQ